MATARSGETEDQVVRYTARLTFDGKTYTTETGDVTVPGTATGETGTDTGDGVCKWCGRHHTGFRGAIVGFFHRILYFFAHLFGKR